MPKLTPDFTIANNSHCLIHAGPVSDEIKDPQHDLVVMTCGGNQLFHNKNGTKTEYVTGTWEEVSGYNIDQKEKPARKILAQNGSIHLIADDGDIYLKARNIFIETTGDKPNGCFLVTANGHINMVGGDEVKVASGTNLCLIGKSKITAVGGQLVGISKSNSGWTSACASADILSAFMQQNFTSFLDGVIQACK